VFYKDHWDSVCFRGFVFVSADPLRHIWTFILDYCLCCFS